MKLSERMYSLRGSQTTDDIYDLAEDVEKLEQQIETLKAESKSTDYGQFRHLEKINKELHGEIETLKAENAVLKCENESLGHWNEKQRRENDSLGRSYAKAKEMESMFDLCVKNLYSSSGKFTKATARKIHIYLAKNDMEHKK